MIKREDFGIVCIVFYNSNNYSDRKRSVDKAIWIGKLGRCTVTYCLSEKEWSRQSCIEDENNKLTLCPNGKSLSELLSVCVTTSIIITPSLFDKWWGIKWFEASLWPKSPCDLSPSWKLAPAFRRSSRLLRTTNKVLEYLEYRSVKLVKPGYWTRLTTFQSRKIFRPISANEYIEAILLTVPWKDLHSERGGMEGMR